MPQSLILAIGRDPGLLHLREEVLRTGGYAVVSTHSINDAVRKITEGDFDAVILCHTLPAGQKKTLISFVRAHSPSTPCVAIHTLSFAKDPLADLTLGSDPLALLAGLKAVLEQSQESRDCHGPQG